MNELNKLFGKEYMYNYTLEDAAQLIYRKISFIDSNEFKPIKSGRSRGFKYWMMPTYRFYYKKEEKPFNIVKKIINWFKNV